MTPEEIRIHLRELDLSDLLDVAGMVAYLIRHHSTRNAHRLHFFDRTLRAHGIDPNSPSAASDLDRRLRGKE
jgi:hypothetical protein